MKTLVDIFEKYSICESKTIENDGHIGIPVNVSFLYDNSFGKIKSGAGGTPIILYVLNANVERIGTAPDDEIIGSMIERGYVVLVLDYMNNTLAASPDLDYSTQAIRRRIIDQKENDALTFSESGKLIETFLVPSGYDVELSNPYWAFDKHGADGILEKITEIWNNDFKGTNAERCIKWTDIAGNRKRTVVAPDGTAPYWCNENGEESADGEYIKLKYTYAESITDCVKKNGDPIDLNLYMHLIYPKRPVSPVPVFCVSSGIRRGGCGSHRGRHRRLREGSRSHRHSAYRRNPGAGLTDGTGERGTSHVQGRRPYPYRRPFLTDSVNAF